MIELYRTCSEVLAAAIIGLIWAAILTPVGQAAYYLYSGIWYPMSCLQPLVWAGSLWAEDPQSWLGVHSIMSWMHIGFACFLLIIVILIPLTYFNNKIELHGSEQSKIQGPEDEMY